MIGEPSSMLEILAEARASSNPGAVFRREVERLQFGRTELPPLRISRVELDMDLLKRTTGIHPSEQRQNRAQRRAAKRAERRRRRSR